MIIGTLCMKDVKKVIGNIDRPNIFIEKQFREGNDDDALEQIIMPIMEGLTKQKTIYPLTIIYLPLQWCGYAYNFFDYHMGQHQYFPYGANPEPSNRLFAQYHSPQTQKMKDVILKQLCSADCTVRVIFATVALGMGVNIPNVRYVIHFGVPGSVRQYFQEIGRAGRDGKPATTVLYYNNRDIDSNRKGIDDDIRLYCRLNDGCLRKYILTTMDANKQDIISVLPGHMCCSYCRKLCTCLSCMLEHIEY